jgi:hypothetical protein
VAHGWPHGVHYALISIVSTETHEEIYHSLTTNLHNDIELPKGSHGKQFTIKVSFLMHINDSPTFNDGAIFSMPRTTDDLLND